MKKDDQQTLTPRLRFPEFRKDNEWAVTSFGQVVEFQSGGTPSKREPTFWNGSIPWVTAKDMKHLFLYDSEDHITTAAVDDGAKLVPAWTVLMLTRGMTLLKDVPICVVRRPMTFNQDVKALHTKESIENCFLPWLVLGCKERLLSMVDVAGHGTGKLNTDELKALSVAIPSRAEQQKIAECLTSLDELIAAQGRKVEALAAHKKGLMQQLFPHEAETLPRLRFPEFQDAGEWVKKPFSDLCNIKHGYAFESEFFSNEGDYVLLTPGNFYEQGGYRDRGEQQKYFTGEISRDFVLAHGDLLIAMTEQAAGLLGSPILIPESDKFLHNQRLGLVTRKPGVAWANEFFFHVFNTQLVRKAIHDTASGAKVRHTSPTKIGEVVVSVPTALPEQQRIADCLSTLDARIAAETEKLAALKTHKQGLMQQLFPFV